MKIIGVILFCTTLLGCGAMVYSIPQNIEYKNTSSFIVGQILETRPGEPMIAKEDVYFYDGLIATTDYQPPLKYGLYNPLIAKGTIFKAIGKLENGNILYKLNYITIPQEDYYCLIADPSGNFYGDGMCDGSYLRALDDKPVNFLKKERIYKKGSNRKELIYNGKSKDTIKLAYREYKDDLARPAFYQDLTYDLSESKIIGFRSMNIEVIEATNSAIKFIVMSPME